MSGFFTKDIVVSYADDDKPVALRLCQILHDWFGKQVWIREFGLNGGDLIYDVLEGALTEAKWLIVVLTKAAIQSEWIQKDATMGTVRSLDSENFKMIVVKLEECNYPRHLEVAFRTQYTVDLSKEADFEDGFMRIAEYIDKSGSTHSQYAVYEGRGADADRFSLVARRNRIVFLVGWRGIGKTSFVEISIQSILRKRALTIPLTPGHSADLLARQIIQVTHGRQPLSSENLSDKELMTMGLSTLKDRSHQHFLFLDDAETALDGSNRLLPYVSGFLDAFLAAKIDTHVIIATTRNPDTPVEMSGVGDTYRLEMLADEYIQEAIRQWLEGTQQQTDLLGNVQKTKQIINVVGGHPLAAKRMASYLKLKTVDQLLEATHRERFQLGFAEYILHATQGNLGELHLLILQIMAAIGEPITQADLLAIKHLIAGHPLADIHKALWELSDWFLIDQKGELLYLHSFLATYYNLRLKKDSALRDNIALDYGMYARAKALDIERLLAQTIGKDDPGKVSQLSNDVFRYALPADRLLRSVGREILADELPIRTKGTLRWLVYHFYQDAKNYRKAIEYAEKWLQVNPDDSDIRLYQVRCYRQLGNKENLDRARQLISGIEPERHKRRFVMRLLREKALIAHAEGDNEAAKAFYREAIELDSSSYQPYSEVYAGLARILIQEADDLPEWRTEREEIASEALDLLDIAKGEPDNFYRFHLDAYVEALIQVHQYDRAYPLLEEALEQRPDDGKLNFRMAEIQRQNHDYESAKDYAELAHKNRYPAGLLTYANILYDEGVRCLSDGKDAQANAFFAQALTKVSDYVTIYSATRTGFELEVADTIRSKIYRALGDYDKAQEVVQKYQNTTNPYTVYERSALYWLKAQKEIAQNRLGDALSSVREAMTIISSYRYKLPAPLEELLRILSAKEQEIKATSDA